MKVKFKIDVSSPAAQAGKAGEVKDVSERAAKLLIDGNYAERADIVPGKKVAAKKVVKKKSAKKKTKKK